MSSPSETYLFSLVDEIQGKEGRLGRSRLSTKERTFILVWALEAEVNNGGFHQFFSNSSGDHSLETARALRMIGANSMASLVDQANVLLGAQGPSTNRNERQEQLESLTEEQQERLSELDTSFYKYPDNLSELLAAYMRANEA
jgi:hypothetical protein